MIHRRVLRLSMPTQQLLAQQQEAFEMQRLKTGMSLSMRKWCWPSSWGFSGLAGMAHMHRHSVIMEFQFFSTTRGGESEIVCITQTSLSCIERRNRIVR
jgi:hypothetical protein